MIYGDSRSESPVIAHSRIYAAKNPLIPPIIVKMVQFVDILGDILMPHDEDTQ